MWYVNHSPVPFPTSQIVGTQTWGGGSDSYFEYLIKYARLTNTDDPLWTQEWAAAVDSSIKVLSSVSPSCVTLVTRCSWFAEVWSRQLAVLG